MQYKKHTFQSSFIKAGMENMVNFIKQNYKHKNQVRTFSGYDLRQHNKFQRSAICVKLVNYF